MADNSPDLFEVLKHIEKGNVAFFNNLQDYEVRKLAPLILMKWQCGTKSANQVKLTNDLVNTLCFSLYKHPQLLYRLLMTSNVDKGKRLTWLKRKSKEKDTEIVKIIKQHTGCSSAVARDYLKILSNDDIIEMAEDIGTDKETLTKLKKELNGKESSL